MLASSNLEVSDSLIKYWKKILSLDPSKSQKRLHSYFKDKPFVLLFSLPSLEGKLKMAANYSKFFFAVLLLLSLQFWTSHKTGSTAAVLLRLSLQSLTSDKTFQVQIRGFKCLLFFCQEKWEETEKKDKWWPSLVWFRHEKREQRHCLFWLFWKKLRHKTTRFLS